MTFFTSYFEQASVVVNSSPPSASSVAGRRHVTTTVSPSARSSEAVTSFIDHSWPRSPSMATTKSPWRTPAAWATEPSNTSTTYASPLYSENSTPTPA